LPAPSEWAIIYADWYKHNGLFEVRAKAKEGIGRALFCYTKVKQINILYAFMKKSQKTPKEIIQIARLRMKEVN
jgi:phage-related protein